jgi:hypothetical protein
MKGMFKNAYIWYDISKWNVDKVDNMDDMFLGSEFDIKLDLSKWNIKKKTLKMCLKIVIFKILLLYKIDLFFYYSFNFLVN